VLISPDFDGNSTTLYIPSSGALSNTVGAGTASGGGNSWNQSPSSGTAYQNTTGAPILYVGMVTLNPASGYAEALFRFSSNGSSYFTMGEAFAISGGSNGQIQTITGFIPNGWYMKWTLTNATVAGQSWGFTSGL
jgi:hypothetical protein